jgi:eukaryotic-like serine/threonine-protein kinase
MIGNEVGPYRVLAKLGEGGMGEVYRARDTRLNRDIAIKVLPASFASDSERRERFEREAQAIAALSHPNIVAVHDTGTYDGQIYLVMELLQGETLRDRLKSGPLPARKAIETGVQIARGLAAAHAKGLVHRDLKPENVFLLADGHVKVLDFGLARAVGTGTGASETVRVVTDPGTVMGTVGYMAPEQVRGQAIDQRADLFALGAVLFEMLTGQRAFRRDTPAETMTAILNDDPPEPSTVRSGLSPALDQIVRHALEKNPAERFQSARDVVFALESLSSATSGPARVVAAPGRRRVWWSIAVMAGIALATAVGVWLGRRTAPASNVKFEVKTWDREAIANARFMPDGAIAYSSAHAGTTMELFVLHPGRPAPEHLAGPGTELLSVSSTGEMAVLTNATYIEQRLFHGTLARLKPGESPRPWLEDIREADWSPDGTTLAVIHDIGGDRDRLEFPAGTPLYEAGGYLSDVRVSHDAQRVAFVEHRDRWDDRGSVKVADRKSHVLALTDEYSGLEGLAWSPDDAQVLFSATLASTPGMQVLAVSTTGGTPARIVLPTPGDTIVLDVDRQGHWLVTRSEMRWGIVVKRPQDAAERDMSWLNLSSRGILSEDGSVLAFSNQNIGEGQDYAVMLRKTDGSPPVRLGDGALFYGGLSPDAQWVVAAKLSDHQILAYPAGAGRPQAIQVPASARLEGWGGWTSDSRSVVLIESQGGAARCYRQALSGGPLERVGPDEDVDDCMPLPDNGLLVLTRAGRALIYDRPDGTPAPIHRPESLRRPLGFAPGGFAFVSTPLPDQGFRLERLNLRTGEKTLVANVTISDRAGLVKANPTSVVGAPGHYGYAYMQARELSTLILVSGVAQH